MAGGGSYSLPPVGVWRSFCSGPLLAPPGLRAWYLLSCLATPTLEGCGHLWGLGLPAALMFQGRCLAGLLSGPPGGFGVFFLGVQLGLDGGGGPPHTSCLGIVHQWYSVVSSVADTYQLLS